MTLQIWFVSQQKINYLCKSGEYVGSVVNDETLICYSKDLPFINIKKFNSLHNIKLAPIFENEKR